MPWSTKLELESNLWLKPDLSKTGVIITAETVYFEEMRSELSSKLENQILTFSHHNKQMQEGVNLLINLINKKELL